MDEIAKMVADKTGLSMDQSMMAVETVVGFIKDKLPEPMQGMVNQFIGGGGGDNAGDSSSGGGIGDILGGLGGMLGGGNK